MFKHTPFGIAIAEGASVPEDKLIEVVNDLEQFYQEVFLELAQFGEIKEMHILDNLGDHLRGNVYVKFVSEEDAEKCKNSISGRSFRGSLVMPEYSPVMDFKEGCCREFETNLCRRGSHCNFMHLKPISPELVRACIKQMYKENKHYLER